MFCLGISLLASWLKTKAAWKKNMAGVPALHLTIKHSNTQGARERGLRRIELI